MRVAARPLAALAALFSAGYLAAYLLPTLTGRLSADFDLTATQSGAVGSALLLSSAAAGLLLASRVRALGPVRTARAGLALEAAGFGLAAAVPAHAALPVAVAGCVLGGLGSGAAVAVAGVAAAAHRDPHRASVLGLLTTCGVSAALYLALPQLPGGHQTAFACVAAWAVLAAALTRHLEIPLDALDAAVVTATGRTAVRTPLPYRRAGAVLAATMLFWSMSQNALWGVSARIGTERAGLGEAVLGVVFALALGGGLVGVAGAATVGPRWGRVLPVGLGTVVIAGCVVLTATSRDVAGFAIGEVAWNSVYPAVLSYLMGLAATLDARGRWAVLAGSSSSLGTAIGPLAGTLLAAGAGFPVMGCVLGAVLLVLAVPLSAVALATRRTVTTAELVLTPVDLPDTPAFELAARDTAEAC